MTQENAVRLANQTTTDLDGQLRASLAANCEVTYSTAFHCWIAVTKGYTGPECPLGSGDSAEEAVDDLLEQIVSRAERRRELRRVK